MLTESEDLETEFRVLRDRCDYFVTYEQELFYHLAQALRPEWAANDVFEATTKLTHTVGQLLAPGVSLDQLRAISTAPAAENKPIQLFLHLKALTHLLSGVSCSLLCNLGASVPAGDPAQRHAFLLAVQERFQLWSNSQLESIKADFDKRPAYSQHSFIVGNLQDTNTSPQVANAIECLFNFTPPDLTAFKLWIEALDGASINTIANLFQFPEDSIVKIWSLLCAPTTQSVLGTSADFYPNLASSFNNPFPAMNASDDGSFGDWNRNKKRTVGGASKHIINLTDSSSGAVSLRLSSSLNIFMPMNKRAAFSPISPSAMHMAQMPMTMDTTMTLDPLPTQSGAFDNLLSASEAPFLSDTLRSSNWAIMPPGRFPTEADEQHKDPNANLQRHFTTPPPPAPHQGDELRSANSAISGLTISQEMNVMPGQLSTHNAQFFPAPSRPEPAAVQGPPASSTRAATAKATTSARPMAPNTMAAPAPLPPGPPAASLMHHGHSASPANAHNVGVVNGVRLELKVTNPPPAKSVYQRILKPYPVVKVIGADKLPNRILFVKASLWNADGTEQMSCLEGGLQVAAQPTSATFKKLKVLNTSVQKGTLFKLKFQLEIFGEREQQSNIFAWSDPMEVVSHTVYLTNPNSSSPTPATVTEAVPNYGTNGTRVVVLGSSFVDLNTVRVKFGDVIAQHTFHESSALIVTVPPQSQGTSRVAVTVSNDGHDYSATSAAFTYV